MSSSGNAEVMKAWRQLTWEVRAGLWRETNVSLLLLFFLLSFLFFSFLFSPLWHMEVLQLKVELELWLQPMPQFTDP